MKKKRIILSAGGTGGHLFPAQAVAKSLPGSEVLFAAGGLKTSPFFDRSTFAYQEISSSTFSLSKPLQVIRRSPKLLKGGLQSYKIIRAFNPDVVVGFGSFYTLPILAAALFSKVPVILHEQNVIPGKVNRLLSRFAHTTAITFSDSADRLRGNIRQVYFPIREQSYQDPWKYFGLKKGKCTLLVFGGSQGAHQLNKLFLGALTHLSDYQVLHFTGEEESMAKSFYRRLKIPHCVKKFEPNLHLAMQIVDLAITRAGASTIAELSHYKTPAILIPFPFATDNHQEKNAAHFIGGKIYLEKDLTTELLADAIRLFPIEEKKKQIEAYENTHTLGHLSELIEEVINYG